MGLQRPEVARRVRLGPRQEAEAFGHRVQVLRRLRAPGLPEPGVQRGHQAGAARQPVHPPAAVRQGPDRLPVRPLPHLALPFGQGRPGVPVALDGARGQQRPRGRQRQQQPGPERRVGPAVAPLAPPLREAAVGHTPQRQPGQVAAEVGGDGRRVGVAVRRPRGQALVD